MVLEKTLESPLDCKQIKPVNPKGNQSWIFIGRTDAKAETPILWLPDPKSRLIRKKPWCWKRLKAGGEGDDRRWHGWIASLTQWTWVWTSSRRWWRTEKPGVLQSVGSQRIGHYLVTEQQHKPIPSKCLLLRLHRWFYLWWKRSGSSQKEKKMEMNILRTFTVYPIYNWSSPM